MCGAQSGGGGDVYPRARGGRVFKGEVGCFGRVIVDLLE